MKIVILYIFLVLTYSCTTKSKICDQNTVGIHGEVGRTEGCMINLLEEGKWKIYDSSGKLAEWGTFEQGVRTGLWHYERGRKRTIEWGKFIHPVLQVKTNIPTSLTVIEDSIDYVKFSNKDSSNLMNLVISIPKTSNQSIPIENYYKIGESQVLQNNWKFNSTRTKLITATNAFYFNEYKIIVDSVNQFLVSNIYGKLKGRLIEVSCRYNELNSEEAKSFFFSVIMNLFFEGDRFMAPFDKVNVIHLDSK